MFLLGTLTWLPQILGHAKCMHDMCGELIDIIGSDTRCPIIDNLISRYECLVNT